ncbi:MAG TPA: carboxypeptidase regulatory-like domain-containing protein [Gemmatimonadaceae bacterium]|nr:carboxypeptidase regulatory-like domain-containing protein [Gemmatimonadaceae bacterium]
MRLRPLVVLSMIAAFPAFAQTTATSDSLHTVEGVVVDSLHGGPLVGAEVILDGTTSRALTDPRGRFKFSRLPKGEYRVAVFHALLDTLSISLPVKVLDVPLERGRAAFLAVPSALTLARAMCPGTIDHSRFTVVAGRLLDPDTEEPVRNATVFASWTEWRTGKDVGLIRTPHKAQAVTDANGAYRLCGLPPELNGRLVATNGRVSTAEIDITGTASPVLVKSLSLADTTAAAIRRASLVGTVRTSTGEPIAGATVTVPGSTASVSTGAAGQFSLQGLPSGTRNVLVRRVGYAPATVAVDLTSREPRRIAVVLGKQLQLMDPVLVTARRERALETVGFTARRRAGLGAYRTRSDFEKAQPNVLSDIVRHMRGVKVTYVDGRPVLTSSRDETDCLQLFVDGSPWMSYSPGDHDDYVLPHDISAVEVYSGASVPPEFETAGNRGCLTIVVWTRAKINDG